MNYKIFETTNFIENLEAVSKSGAKKIEKKLHDHIYPTLKLEPHFGPNIKKLQNWNPPTYRYRIGTWRFFYEVNEKTKIVFMTAAHHRKDAYR